MPRALINALAALILTLLGAPASAQHITPVAAGPRFQTLRDEIMAEVRSGRAVSISIGVVADGRVVWAESFGFANREAAIRADVDTPYALASLGKSITATAVLRLAEAGRLNLDEPVSRLVPDAIMNQACDRQPTIRQLLNMTAGIPHGYASFAPGIAVDQHAYTAARAIAAFCPGEVFHYSNYSFGVAERVVEAASGLEFPRYLERYVFAPLAMRHSSLGTATEVSGLAARYDSDGTRIPAGRRPFPRSSLQMNASLSDLLNYVAFSLGTPFAGERPVLSRESLDMMHFARPTVPGALMALGWGSFEASGGRRWLISNGSAGGAQSSIMLLPDERIGAVVLINSSGGQADGYALRAVDSIAPGFAESARRARAAYQAQATGFHGGEGWTGAWSGRAATAQGTVATTVSIGADGTVALSLAGQPSVAIENARLDHGLLTGRFNGTLPVGERAAAPYPIDLVLHQDGGTLTGLLTATFVSARGSFSLPMAVRLVRTP